jgi:hypothetical protein
MRAMGQTPNVVALQDHLRARSRADEPGGASLDLVARLFDVIAADEGITPVARAELARLRLPTLRAARIANDFLVNRSHPARRLLDAIAAAAAGLDENTRADDATASAITRAVHDVLTEFDSDLAPFDAIAARLGAFLDERTRAEDAAARRIAQKIAVREREQASMRAGDEAVARRLHARLWVPPEVRAMLHGPWVRALAAAHRDGGEESSAWQALVRTMEDLLWSVEPKASPEGRRRLAAMLPGLIEALARGLRNAGMGNEARDAFLSALVDCHAHAMKVGMRGIAAVPDAPGEPAEAISFARETFAVGDQRVEEVRLGGTSEGAARAAAEAAPRLHPGSWIELERGARNAARKRLAWVSPVTGLFLFVGVSPGSMAVAISPAALAELQRRGEARAIDLTPLVDRILTVLLARFAPA